ncbi:hypothetical protein AVEN_217806-1 [Araneus ventricosus]|uniref:Uncharacterized protein n=1 Tax=Araneus ventricosus TaxID=182803 RepID=A0A4Y2SMP5_ARAVE|nr:hypothetical protein AVEN_217806-1 [Araneus ventricosus]
MSGRNSIFPYIQDKTSNHASKSSIKFVEKIKQETGFNPIPKSVVQKMVQMDQDLHFKLDILARDCSTPPAWHFIIPSFLAHSRRGSMQPLLVSPLERLTSSPTGLRQWLPRGESRVFFPPNGRFQFYVLNRSKWKRTKMEIKLLIHTMPILIGFSAMTGWFA